MSWQTTVVYVSTIASLTFILIALIFAAGMKRL